MKENDMFEEIVKQNEKRIYHVLTGCRTLNEKILSQTRGVQEPLTA